MLVWVEGVSIACVVVASSRRRELLDREVIPSVVAQGFSEVIVAGEYHDGDGYRYLHIPDVTKSTVDALIKRDAGTAATSSPVLVYVCDDHALHPQFGECLRYACETLDAWDVLVPSRWADHPDKGRIRINNGEGDGYCGGHCGVFKRHVIQHTPWSAQPHDRLWDLLASRNQQQAGFQFMSVMGLACLDLEPFNSPWQ